MPEMSLNRDKDLLFVSGVPGQHRTGEIPYPSSQATELINEAADENGSDPKKIENDLLKGQSVEF